MSRIRFKPWMALGAVLLFLVVAFFGTFFIYGGTNFTSNASNGLAQNGVGSVTEPVVEGAHSFTGSVKDFFNRLFALRDVDKKYNDLQIKVQQLEVQNQLMQSLQQDNEQLRKLLDTKDKLYPFPQYKCVTAEVIGRDSGSNWFMNFTLNRGSSDGITKEMNVVNEDGLVGRVVEVGSRWCKVRALIDPQSSVPALVGSARSFGMVSGAGDPQGSEPVCSIDYLVNADVVPGDKVITSELGGHFIKGLFVGTVSTVSRDKNNNITATLTPAVDFSSIEFVLILTSDQKVPTQQDIEAEESAMANATASPGPGASSSPQPSSTRKSEPADTKPASGTASANTAAASPDDNPTDIPG